MRVGIFSLLSILSFRLTACALMSCQKKHRLISTFIAASPLLPYHRRAANDPAGAYLYCFGFIEIDPISRVSIVTQLICRLYPLGVWVWKLL